MEPLNKLYGALNEEEVYNNALSAKQNFIRSSQSLLELKVPIALPDDTKTLIERSKVEIASGLKFLGEGMNYLAQYIASRNPVLYDKYIEKRERGILYVHGGLTTLDSARLQLDASEEPLKIIWEVDEKTFFNQEHPQ